jgi:hypothetical protein
MSNEETRKKWELILVNKDNDGYYGERTSLFFQCCRIGDINLLKEMYQNNIFTEILVKLTCNFALQSACRYGHLNICKWIYLNLYLKNKNILFGSVLAFQWAVTGEHLEICKWLFDTFELTKEQIKDYNKFVLNDACMKNSFEIVQFLFDTVGFTEEDAESVLPVLNNYQREKLKECVFTFGSRTKPVMH